MLHPFQQWPWFPATHNACPPACPQEQQAGKSLGHVTEQQLKGRMGVSQINAGLWSKHTGKTYRYLSGSNPIHKNGLEIGGGDALSGHLTNKWAKNSLISMPQRLGSGNGPPTLLNHGWLEETNSHWTAVIAVISKLETPTPATTNQAESFEKLLLVNLQFKKLRSSLAILKWYFWLLSYLSWTRTWHRLFLCTY